MPVKIHWLHEFSNFAKIGIMARPRGADWLEDEPELIPDPEATKPDDWDDEEDGDWVAPTIANPKCIDASGCGKWIRPMKKNPAYKGKWTSPMIDNPEYKGVWKPRRIANPGYFKDASPSTFEKVGGIGFERVSTSIGVNDGDRFRSCAAVDGNAPGAACVLLHKQGCHALRAGRGAGAGSNGRA